MAKEKTTQMKEVFNEVLKTLHEAQEAPPAEDVDIDQALKDLETGLEELNARADALYKATGMTRQQVDEYAKNPSNFSKEEWKMLEEIREELGSMREEAEEALAGPPPSEEEKAKQAKRKQRPRKKKWLQG